jgi:hypothetical protein
MSTLQKMQELGLTAELETAVVQFMDGAEADDKKKADGKQQLLAAIDKDGLKNASVMKLIGTLQRDKILKPGLYKELVELNKKMNGEAQPAEVKPGEAQPITEGTSVTEVTPSESTEVTADSEDKSLQFTEKQENKLKDRMKKEEEKMRKRLLDKEKKIRERLASRAEKRASRLGMKVEEAKDVQDAKEFIAKKRAEIKAMRLEIKTKRELIKSLRPKRARKTPEEKAAEKEAKAAAKAAANPS